MTTIVQLNSLQRAVTFIQNVWNEKGTVSLKGDGSVPASLPHELAWTEEKLASYLQEEVRMYHFQRAMKEKGYASMFLIAPYAASVLHIRVLPGAIVFHYVD